MNIDKKLTVGILFGGKSTEHEVSRNSAKCVLENIDRDKFDVVMIGITKEGKWYEFTGDIEKIPTGEWENETKEVLDKLFNKEIDVVFPVMHGNNCEDGTMQGFLKTVGIPFVGPGVMASALGMEKSYAKIIFDKEGIPQCKHVTYTRNEIDSDIDKVVSNTEKVIGYPCFIKPSNSGSSIGVSKATDRSSLIDGLKNACKYDFRILVEEFFDGREIECAVLGNENPKASVLGEIIPDKEFYDYESKYINNKSIIQIPAQLSEEDSNTIRDYAVRAFKALDCKGLSRVDFFVHRETGKIVLNEINTLPGFTTISMYSKLWEADGLSYSHLITKLIELAMGKEG